MTLFPWKPEYSVQQTELDEHHRNLFAILNSLYEHVMNSPDVGSVLPRIDELSAYTRLHFSAEEQYMLEQGFPNIIRHIGEHREFTNKIELFRKKHGDNDLEIMSDLIVVLGEWLLQHVLKEDRKYSLWSSGNRHQ